MWSEGELCFRPSVPLACFRLKQPEHWRETQTALSYPQHSPHLTSSAFPMPVDTHSGTKGGMTQLKNLILFLPFLLGRSIALSLLSRSGELRLRGDVSRIKHRAALPTEKAIGLRSSKWESFSSGFWVCWFSISDWAARSILIEPSLVTVTKFIWRKCCRTEFYSLTRDQIRETLAGNGNIRRQGHEL